MKKILIFLTLTILLSFNVSADMFPYNLFSGSITLSDGSTSTVVPSGAILSTTIGGSDAGSYTIESVDWYAMAVTPPPGTSDGDAITFSLDRESWSVTSCTSSTYSDEKEDGTVRWLDIACTGTAITSETGDSSGGSGAGGGGDAGAAVVEVPTKVTDPTQIAQIIAWIDPAELGLESIGLNDVIITELRELSETTQIGVDDLGALMDEITDEIALDALNQMEEQLAEGGQKLEVYKTLNVYKIQSKENNNVVIRSKLTVTVVAQSDSSDIKILEVIPKTVANHVDDIIFLGEQPKVLQADPVVQWTVPFMSAGLSKTFEYVVKKELTGIEGKTVAIGTKSKEGKVIPELPPAKPTYGWLIALAVIVAGLIWYFSRKRNY